MANENFVQQRRFSGLDLYHAPQDVGPDQLLQSDNCVNYGGELWTRPGFQAMFANALSGPIHAATEFVRTDGSTVILFVSGGKLYYTVKQDAPMTPTEILIGGASFALNSDKVRIYVEGKYAYVVDGEYAYSDLKVDASDPTKVTSAARPFSMGDASVKQLKITGGTNFTIGTYTISSVSGSVATLSSSVGTVNSVGGVATLSGPLYRVHVPADGVMPTATAVTGLTPPGSAPSCSLTNTVQEPVSDASKWHSFPAFTGNALSSVSGSSQTPIQITLTSRAITDLAIPAVSNQVTSASFTAADVGSVLKITSTTPFNPGYATITSVVGTTATLSYNPTPITSATQPVDYVAGTVGSTLGHATVLPVTLADGMKITVSGVLGNTAANGTWYVVGTGNDVTYSLYGTLAYSAANYISSAFGNPAAVAASPNGNYGGGGTFTIAQLVANPGFNSTANNSNNPHTAAGSAQWWTNGQGGSTSFDLPQWHYSSPSIAYGSALFLDNYGPVLQITRATNQYGIFEPACHGSTYLPKLHGAIPTARTHMPTQQLSDRSYTSDQSDASTTSGTKPTPTPTTAHNIRLSAPKRRNNRAWATPRYAGIGSYPGFTCTQ